MAGGYSPITAAAEAVTEGFANFDPHNAADLMGMFETMPDFFEELARALNVLAQKSEDELPIHPATQEGIREIAAVLGGLHDQAGELNKLFRETHAKEIERIEEPRPQEQLWDVSTNN